MVLLPQHRNMPFKFSLLFDTEANPFWRYYTLPLRTSLVYLFLPHFTHERGHLLLLAPAYSESGARPLEGAVLGLQSEPVAFFPSSAHLAQSRLTRYPPHKLDLLCGLVSWAPLSPLLLVDLDLKLTKSILSHQDWLSPEYSPEWCSYSRKVHITNNHSHLIGKLQMQLVILKFLFIFLLMQTMIGSHHKNKQTNK